MKILSNPKREQAAQLISEGQYEYGEIAEKLGVDRKTLHRWRNDPRFVARVDHLSREFSESTKQLAIRRKDYRISVLNRLHTKLVNLIEQRAADSTVKDAAGGDQGLIVKQFKVSGDNQVTEYVFDRAVLQELRAVQEQAAKELGQLTEKHEHKISSLKDLSDDELASIAAELDGAGEVESGSSEGD
jgi:transposase-like protein